MSKPNLLCIWEALVSLAEEAHVDVVRAELNHARRRDALRVELVELLRSEPPSPQREKLMDLLSSAPPEAHRIVQMLCLPGREGLRLRVLSDDSIRKSVGVAWLDVLKCELWVSRAIASELGVGLGDPAWSESIRALQKRDPGFAGRLLREAEKRFPEVAKALKTRLSGAKSTKRRRRQTDKVRPLTERQAEVLVAVGECNGSLTAAAKRLGIDRKTVAQHYEVCLRKLGHKVVRHATRRLPTDRRGQLNISPEDDRRRGI